MGQIVQSTYAGALFDVARESDKLDDYFAEIKELRSLFQNEKEFSTILESPQIKVSEKRQVLDNVFKNKVSSEILNFLKILVDKRRIYFFTEICDEFEKMYNDYFGILVAKIFSAYELDSSEIQSLRIKLEETTGSKINIICKIDDSLIGGIKIVIGDKIIDQTALNKLKQLGASLKEISL